MSYRDIEPKGAYDLPAYVKDAVTEECKKRAIPHVTLIAAVLVFIVLGCGIPLMILLTSEPGDRGGLTLWLLPFPAAVVFIVYKTFVPPVRELGLARAGRYQYFMGEATDADRDEDDNDSPTGYYIILEGRLRCKCTREQYLHVEFGDIYIAVFFSGESSPSMCARVPEKDLI